MQNHDTIAGFEAKALFRIHQGKLIVEGCPDADAFDVIEGRVHDSASFTAHIGPFGVTMHHDTEAHTHLFIDMPTYFQDGEWHASDDGVVQSKQIKHIVGLSPVRSSSSPAGRSITHCFWCSTSLPYYEAIQAGWKAVFIGDTHRFCCDGCVKPMMGV